MREWRDGRDEEERENPENGNWGASGSQNGRAEESRRWRGEDEGNQMRNAEINGGGVTERLKAGVGVGGWLRSKLRSNVLHPSIILFK